MDGDKGKSLITGWVIKEKIGECIVDPSVFKILSKVEFEQEYSASFVISNPDADFEPYMSDEDEEYIPYHSEEGI